MNFFNLLTNVLAITNSGGGLSTIDALRHDLTNILTTSLTPEIYSNSVQLCLNHCEEGNYDGDSIVKKFKGKKNYLRQLNKLRAIKKIKIIKDINLISNISEIDKNVINVESRCDLSVYFTKRPLILGISSNYILNNENKIQTHIINNLIINDTVIDIGYLAQKYINSTSSIDRSFCGLIIFIILSS